MSPSPTRERIKQILVESLHLEGMTPDMIGDEDPLWGDGLGLDSVDALELMVALEKEYGFRIDSEQIDAEAMGTVAQLEAFVEGVRATHGEAAVAGAR